MLWRGKVRSKSYSQDCYINGLLDRIHSRASNHPFLYGLIYENDPEVYILVIKLIFRVLICYVVFKIIDIFLIEDFISTSTTIELVFYGLLSLRIGMPQYAFARFVFIIPYLIDQTTFTLVYFFFFKDFLAKLLWNDFITVAKKFISMHFCATIERMKVRFWITKIRLSPYYQWMSRLSDSQNTQNIVSNSNNFHDKARSAFSETRKASANVENLGEKCSTEVKKASEKTCSDLPVGFLTCPLFQNELSNSICSGMFSRQNFVKLENELEDFSLPSKLSKNTSFFKEVFKQEYSQFENMEIFTQRMFEEFEEQTNSLWTMGVAFNSLLILYIFYKAFTSSGYINRWMKDVDFENMYFDRGCRQRSAMLKVAGYGHWMPHPMKRSQRHNIVYHFGRSLNEAEQARLAFRKKILFAVIIFLGFCLWAKTLLLNEYSEYRQMLFDYPSEVHYNLNFSIELNTGSLLGKVLNSYLRVLEVKNKTERYTPHFRTCVGHSVKFNYSEWVQCVIILILIKFLINISPYLGRLKQYYLIYAFPDVAKKRSDHVFKIAFKTWDDNRKARLEILKKKGPPKTKDRTNKLRRFGYTKFNKTRSYLRRMLFFVYREWERVFSKRCFQCGEKITQLCKGLAVCDDQECWAIYCLECFDELQHTCIDCSKKISTKKIHPLALRNNFNPPPRLWFFYCFFEKFSNFLAKF